MGYSTFSKLFVRVQFESCLVKFLKGFIRVLSRLKSEEREERGM